MPDIDTIKTDLELNPRIWLVTGVAGFIGSNLLEQLLNLGQTVVGLDNFETGYKKNIEMAISDADLEPKTKLFSFFEGDIRKLDHCRQVCEGVDYVLHHAALGSVPRSLEDPIRTNQANIDGFLNMLVASRDAGVERFVYAASSSTYGDHPDLPKVENKIGNPLSPYAVTKVVNEMYADIFFRAYGLNSIGLRYFNIFGKRQDPDGAYAAVIPKWVSSIVKGEDVYINGDGETSRDFCYIDNVCQINLLAATTTNTKALNQIYNVALNDRTSLNHLYEMIENKLMALIPELEHKDPIYRDFRPGDVRHSQADISKSKRLLNYSPTHRISKGLDESMVWYKDSLT